MPSNTVRKGLTDPNPSFWAMFWAWILSFFGLSSQTNKSSGASLTRSPRTQTSARTSKLPAANREARGLKPGQSTEQRYLPVPSPFETGKPEPRALPLTRPIRPTGSGESDRSLVEGRWAATHGEPIVTIAPLVDHRSPEPIPVKTDGRRATRGTRKVSGADVPPTPPGCKWLKTDNGWNLWRYWTETDKTGKKERKARYAGFLSNEAWETMKDYDYETFIGIIGQRLRRYGQR